MASRILPKPDRTLLTRGSSHWKLDRSRPVLFVGSCFADVISAELAKRKFDVIANPQGTMFNPYSISKCLSSVVNFASNESSIGTSIFRDKNHGDVYHSWDHSSKFSDTSLENIKRNVYTSLSTASSKLKTASGLFLTLGTSFVHTISPDHLGGEPSNRPEVNRVTGEVIVSNCHKQPSQMFKKRLLSVDETVDSLSNAIDKVVKFNCNIKVALTISPIRHTRDGLIENQRSKAVLVQAVHTLCELERFKNVVNYFPSYELVMDELRDYRWYADDLVHLSKPAEEAVYCMFEDYYLSSKCREVNKEIMEAVMMFSHRPIVMGLAYRDHLLRTLKKFDEVEVKLRKSYPENAETKLFEEERQTVHAILNTYSSNN